MILKYKIHYKFYCLVYFIMIYLLYTDTRLGRLCTKGVCKSRNPTRNTRNPPGTPGTPPGTPGTPGTVPGTRWNTSYEATHVFLYKFTCFALNSGCWMVTIFTFTCIVVSLNNFSHGQG